MIQPYSDRSLSEASLNQWGSSGWELVTTVPTLIFKRPLAHAVALDFKQTDKPRPQLLRMTEVAQQLGLSRTTVYKMVNAGVLAYVKPSGRAIRIPTAAVDEWIASQRRVYSGYGEK